MTEKIRKVLSFPSPVPAKADYQRVKSSYSVREIKQMFGLGERTVRRWTEAGIIYGTPVGESGDVTYVFHALSMSRHVEAHYNLANLYYDAGDFPLARLHYEAATQIEPNFSLVYYNLALVYHRLNNVPAAKQSLNRYKDLEPGDEEIELVDQLLKAMETGRPGG